MKRVLCRNGMLGRSKTLQVARQWTNEDFGRVAGQRKVARADSTRELAEWGVWWGVARIYSYSRSRIATASSLLLAQSLNMEA